MSVDVYVVAFHVATHFSKQVVIGGHPAIKGMPAYAEKLPHRQGTIDIY